MVATPHRCPGCSQPLWISNDMWGPYYLCDDCGWTAEDDDDLLTEREPQGVLLDAMEETSEDAGRQWSA